jgi:hypothetical protein
VQLQAASRPSPTPTASIRFAACGEAMATFISSPALLRREHEKWSRGTRDACPPATPFLHALSPRLRPATRATLRARRARSDVRASLSVEDFDNRVMRGEMRVCLVGMSNCGKSHWSTQLHTGCGYSLVCVDAEIEKAIEPELCRLGFAGIDGMAEWMGFPTDSRFAANQDVYLTYEEKITAAAIASGGATGTNYVLDTTGSVVYLSRATLDALRASFLVIHLEASDDMLEMMTDNYFLTPKPVAWGDSFDQKQGETADCALRRCYPRLLRERRARYAKLAHVTIPGAVSLSRDLHLPGFLDLVRAQLTARSAAAGG